MTTVVMKFGGASVATPKHFHSIADVVLQRKKRFRRLVIVVSAMANTTGQLIQLANEVNTSPPSREYDMLVSVGERISISLLAMALAGKGESAVSFTGSQSGIMTSDEHSNARIVEMRPHRLCKVLDEEKIAIVAGFQGCSLGGEITTLGANGSDISAVALGVALKAVGVEFYKDVRGVYDRDPKLDDGAQWIPELTYDKALNIVRNGGRILHPRCLELAKQNGLPLSILSFHKPDTPGTRIVDPSVMPVDKPCYETCLSEPIHN